MEYEEIIFKSRLYIEENIKENLTIKIIAYNIGYSEYHFSRIFKDKIGISPMEYVQERRLILASKEIFKGKKIIDVAMEHGYETHSGFTKSFKKKFGFTPTQHLICALKIMEYLNYENGDDLTMNENLENGKVFLNSSLDFTKPEELFKKLINILIDKYTNQEMKLVEIAYNIAFKAHNGQYRKSGEAYITHPLSVAVILAELDVDVECVIVGLLHDIELNNTLVKIEDLKIELPKEITELVELFTKTNISNINKFIDENDIDSRIILIKLAERLHNMRTIKYMEPERYKEKAKETIEIFSPIANKFNMLKLKMELDDLAFEYYGND